MVASIEDVARRAGVSIATVSRALREPHRVSGDTRDRVLAAIDELGYRPNRAAASLRRGRTGVIALVVPDIENPYFSSMTKGAQAASRERGYGLVVVDTTERADVEALWRLLRESVARADPADPDAPADLEAPDARP